MKNEKYYIIIIKKNNEIIAEYRKYPNIYVHDESLIIMNINDNNIIFQLDYVMN
jgi:hypothetical protein